MKSDELRILVEDLKEGKDDALAKIYEEFYTPFFYMAFNLCNNEADAQDALQDTFISIKEHINSLRNPDVFILWMKQILFNRCKNIFRKNRDVYMEEQTLTSLEVKEYKQEYTPELHMERMNNQSIVLSLLSTLPYMYREPLLLKYYDEATMEEIGKILKIPTGTVKSRLRTGKQLMRKAIKQYETSTNEKVPFHSLPVGVVCMLMFRKEKHLQHMSSGTHMAMMGSTTMNVVVAVALTCIGGVGVNALYHEYANQEKLKNEINKTVQLSNQRAYFILRDLAHCKAELKEMNNEELMALQPYVEQLEREKGAFYQLLLEDEWMDTFYALAK